MYFIFMRIGGEWTASMPFDTLKEAILARNAQMRIDKANGFTVHYTIEKIVYDEG